jgi:hypothetical protein
MSKPEKKKNNSHRKNKKTTKKKRMKAGKTRFLSLVAVDLDLSFSS